MSASAGTAIFRADAAPRIGGGHVMRCLTLAAELQAMGWRCEFATKADSFSTIPALRHALLPPLLLVEGEDEMTALRSWRPNGVDVLVVDHYGLGAAFEVEAFGWAQCVAAFDDMPTRFHKVGLLIDQTLGRMPQDYAGLVPPDCRLLTGAGYAVLRPEFRTLRPASLARRRGEGTTLKILVSMGAVDSDNATGTVLDGLELLESVPVTVTVVVGAACPHGSAIARRVAGLGGRLIVDCRDMAGLMAESDLAIGTAGTTTWERCALGLPSAMIVVAQNQSDIAAAMHRAGAALSLGWIGDVTPEAIACACRDLACDLAEASRAAASVCDGLGAVRVASELAMIAGQVPSTARVPNA